MSSSRFRMVFGGAFCMAVTGCSCDDSSSPVLPDEALPGPLPGWVEDFDGIACRHPPVEASCIEGWCRIPPGCFIMGSPADEWGHPAHVEDQRAVTLTRGFLIGQHEVTQEQWTAMGWENPSAPLLEGGGDCTHSARCPVGNVTWFEAVAFANTQSKRHEPPLPPCYVIEGCTGEPGEGMICETARLAVEPLYDCHGFRLATDAEWEYAARASTRTAFYSGTISRLDGGLEPSCYSYDHLDATAWYCSNSSDWTQPVGQKRPNAWHLYDMMGNVREWVHDEHTGSPPPPGPLTDPGGGLRTYERRQTRGGSALVRPLQLRSAAGLESDWGFRAPTYGLRLVRTE